MGELPAMNDFKDSIILMGVDWSRGAKKKAFKDIRRESPRVASVIEVLDRFYRKKN